MDWRADWFVNCYKCHNFQWFDGDFKAAQKNARKAGWSVRAGHWVCPKHETVRRKQPRPSGRKE